MIAGMLNNRVQVISMQKVNLK